MEELLSFLGGTGHFFPEGIGGVLVIPCLKSIFWTRDGAEEVLLTSGKTCSSGESSGAIFVSGGRDVVSWDGKVLTRVGGDIKDEDCCVIVVCEDPIWEGTGGNMKEAGWHEFFPFILDTKAQFII